MRNVTAVLGPTNTGKTHLAIERMLGHESGLIGLPLRLLAREVYEKVARRAGEANVALITGEEKIKPPNPRYYVCTVEAMPREVDTDFLAVDEIQLSADPERGHVFTNRIYHARGQSETLLLGADTMRDMIRDLVPNANIVTRPRMSKLTYAGAKKITRLPRRSAIVAFSANDVYEIAELIRRQRGGAAVVMGGLSPRTRNAQVALYQSGDVDFLVATDAIGMGLNLDLNHVAFAAIRKFDGQDHRDLTPAELAQIAGRAGRHMNDGTFGVTANVQSFDSELINCLENHQFAPVRTLQWRSSDLDLSSVKRLKDSLIQAPDGPKLTRTRKADDFIALENVSRDQNIGKLACSPAAVGKLWEVCQMPDYRKISPTDHAELVASVYKFLMGSSERINEDWFAEQVAQSDRTDGGIDALSNRISHIRTWTFASNRHDWLEDPVHWQERTREIEDRLSDALHERLTQAFVDRRTSVLMRRLRDKEELYAEIADDGAIHVEDHFVGTISGFRFSPDGGGKDGIHNKAARNAAAGILAKEFASRAERLSQAGDEAFSLCDNGEICWEGHAVARIERGETPLKPGLRLVADEQLAGPDREKVTSRLDGWLAGHIAQVLEPLVALSNADEITGLGRGIAFRLCEALGSLKRETVADEIRQLDQPARKELRKYGVRFGAFNIYFPALLKPAPSKLTLQLWRLFHGEGAGIDPENLPAPPRAGLTSDQADPRLPEAFYRAAGYHLCGSRAVRIDMLERLGDMLRPLLTWRPPRETEDQPQTPATTKPEGATGDGGFTVQPDMLSIMGCTPDEFTVILRALGFRLERHPIDAQNVATESSKDADIPPAAKQDDVKDSANIVQLESEKTTDEVVSKTRIQTDMSETRIQKDDGDNSAAEEPAIEEPAYLEIWRPRKRKPQYRGGRAGPRDTKTRHRAGKAHPQGSSKKPLKQRRPSARPPGKKSTRIDPDSPFAALGALKKELQNKKREKA